MITLRWMSFLLMALCLTLTLVRMTADGITVIAAVAFVVWAWALGALRSEFWAR